MLPSFSLNSKISFDKHTIAIISDATVISKWSSLCTILLSPESPVFTVLNCLSFKSTHLFHTTFLNFSSFPKYMWLSIIADNKLFADVIA